MRIADLIAEGYCSPMCLLALIPEGRCKCRCGNRFHGLASDLDLEVNLDGLTPEPPAIAVAASPYSCAACGRKIHKSGGHNRTDHGLVVCANCALNRSTHKRLWPDCEHAWHDPFDHLVSVGGTRAGFAAAGF